MPRYDVHFRRINRKNGSAGSVCGTHVNASNARQAEQQVKARNTNSTTDVEIVSVVEI